MTSSEEVILEKKYIDFPSSFRTKIIKGAIKKIGKEDICPVKGGGSLPLVR